MDKGFKRNMRINSGGNMATTLRFLGVFLGALSLAGCSGGGFSSLIGDEPQTIETLQEGVNRVSGGRDFAGIISADEPQAVLAARDILERGGNAVDAATALYFSLAVTYDGAASLGGGGVCLVKPSAKHSPVTISFLAAAAPNDGDIAIPGNVRGFAYLHAQYGTWGWKSLVEPGASLASQGYQVSKAMHAQWNVGKEQLEGDEWLASRYLRAGGKMISIGRESDNIALATTLGLIGARGPEPFYTGKLAATYIKNANAHGENLSLSDLRGYRVKVSDPVAIENDGVTYYLPGGRGSAGLRKSWIDWTMIDSDPKPALDAGATSFYVVDRAGQAVSCALSQNGVFGAGKGSVETGVVFAKAEPTSLQVLVPVIGANASGDLTYISGTARGGSNVIGQVQLTDALKAGGDFSLSEIYSRWTTPTNAAYNILACQEGWDENLAGCQFGIIGNSGGLAIDARRR